MEPASDKSLLHVDSQIECLVANKNLDQSCTVEQASNFGISAKQQCIIEEYSIQEALNERSMLMEAPIEGEIWITNVETEPRADPVELEEAIIIIDTDSDDDSSEQPPSKKFRVPTTEEDQLSTDHTNEAETQISRSLSIEDCSLKCDICGRQFTTKTGLRRHMEADTEHLGIKDLLIECEICQQLIKGVRNYRDHLNRNHGPDGDKREAQCEICLKEYTDRKALNNHKLHVHIEAKFECDFCGRKFKRERNLKDHRARHTGETPYSCEFCEYTGQSHVYFFTHVKKYHPDKWAEKKLKRLRRSSSNYTDSNLQC